MLVSERDQRISLTCVLEFLEIRYEIFLDSPGNITNGGPHSQYIPQTKKKD